MCHFFVVFSAAEDMVTIAVMCLTTPTEGQVQRVEDGQAQFARDGICEVPIMEAVVGVATAHRDKWIRHLGRQNAG